jgi:NADPH2:quinone reductase
VRTLVFEKFGGPEVLHLTDLPTPELSPGHARVRLHAIGMNFADVYRRRGNYPLPGAPPWVLGYEGAGEIQAIDGPANGLRVGDRVAFADVPRANAEQVIAPLTHLVPLPEDISYATAAALLLQGLTAHYLVHDSHPLAAGQTAVVHAAAGGVGLLLVQLAKERGAQVIALVSSDEKAARAKQAGADQVLRSGGDWVAQVRAASRDGQGADVVYDSVGSTLGASLDATRRGGRVVFYGMAGGDPAPVDPRRLMDESKSLTGGDLWNVLTSREERVRRANELFALVRAGRLEVAISRVFPLAAGAEAHRFLESRQSIGKVLLSPGGA